MVKNQPGPIAALPMRCTKYMDKLIKEFSE